MNNILKLFLVLTVALNVTALRADEDGTSDVADADVDVVVTEDVASDDVSPGAAPVAAVAARMDCKTLKAKISELTAAGDDAAVAPLQVQYRRDCVVRASGLRTAYRGGAPNTATAAASATPTVVASLTKPSPTVPKVTQITDAQKEMCDRLPDAIASATDDNKSVLQGTYDEYCAKNVAAPDAVIKTTMLVLGPVAPAETEEERYARIAANLDAGLCPDGEKPNRFGCCKGETFKDLGNLEFGCCPKDGGDCFLPVK